MKGGPNAIRVMIPSEGGAQPLYTGAIDPLPESVSMRHLPLTILASAFLCSASPSWAQARVPSAPAQAAMASSASAPSAQGSAAATAAATAASQAKAKPKASQQALEIDPNEPHIKRAMKKAQARSGEVLKVAASGDAKYENVGVRVLVREGPLQEIVWLMPFEKREKGYVGIVNAAPTVLKRLQFRMFYPFTQKDIVDWMYTDTSKKTMHGQFITCAQVRKDAPEDAAELKRRHGLDCSR